MFDFFGKCTAYFGWGTTDLAKNCVWKLYSKASVALCMLAAALCICSTYFGNPMDCYGTEDKFVNQYCWVHGSYRFALGQKPFAERLAKRIGANCIPADYYNTDADEKPTTEYYQWVIFMLIGHGILFMLPNRLWKFFEDGLIKEFLPFEEQKDYEIDDEEMRQKVKKFVVIRGWA